MSRPVLTKVGLWPPCEWCGSDGYPADLGGNRYLCYDCYPEWLKEEFADRTWLPDALRRHEEMRDEILALREDPTCFSYRGLGRVG